MARPVEIKRQRKPSGGWQLHQYINKLHLDTETGQVESPDLVGEGSEVRLELTYGKHRDNHESGYTLL